MGYSPFSPEILITAGLPPTPEGNIITSNEGTFVRISWGNAFNFQELPLLAFNISILDSDGKWINGRWLNEYCDSMNATILSQMYCIVPMQVFLSVSSY